MRTYKIGTRTKDPRIKSGDLHEFYQSLDPESNKISEWIEKNRRLWMKFG